MPRAIGTATVTFGLVSIPIKLYSATQSQAAISFNLLHKKCNSRLKQQYLCSQDGEVVPRDEMVKGYEFAKDQYVVFTPEELKAIEQEADQTIEIAEFVPAAKVDPVYFDKAYYLGPDKGGDKSYKLLSAAMQETGRAALAKYAARGKQYLVLLRPVGERLVMQQLHYADEVRPMNEVPLGDSEVRAGELKLAVQLIQQIATDTFHPEAYTDEVKQRIEALVEKKVAGQEVAVAPSAAPEAQIVDLMEALKASLAKSHAATPAAEPGAPAERKPAHRAERKPRPARRAKGDK